MSAKTAYRPDIDGLRAVAVLGVIAYHYGLPVPGGFVGVDIFFVISGYLISGHIFQSLAAQKFSILDFYRRRIRRIFPALLVVLVACLAFGWFALLADEYAQLGKHTTAGALFLANIAFWREVGYFDNSSITKPLLHLWSLGVEEQFYIVWPAAALTLWRFRLGGWKAIAVIALVSFVLNMATITPNATAAFYSPWTRFWELLIGATLAQVEQKRVSAPSKWLTNAASLSGAVLLSASLFLITHTMPFPGVLALAPTFGAALMIFAGQNATINRWALSTSPMTGIGVISYPLYLWHWPLLSFAHIMSSGPSGRAVRVGLIVASFVLAALTYWLVERPIRFGRWRRTAVVIPLAIAMALVGSAGASLYFAKGLPDRPAAVAGARLASQFVGSLWPYMTNQNCMNRYPFPEAAEHGWWFCMLEKDEPATILVTGGSFANQLYPGLAHNKDLERENVLSIGTCAPLYMAPGSENGPKTTTPCSGLNWTHQNEFINKIVQDTPSIRTVIVDGLHSSSAPVDVDRIVKRLEQLRRPGVQVIVFLPHYKTDLDVRGCFARPLMSPRYNCDISQADFNALISSNQAIADSIHAKLPDVMTFEQNNAFCTAGKCSLIADGYPLIRDEYHHISEFASEIVGRQFVEWAATHYPILAGGRI